MSEWTSILTLELIGPVPKKSGFLVDKFSLSLGFKISNCLDEVTGVTEFREPVTGSWEVSTVLEEKLFWPIIISGTELLRLVLPVIWVEGWSWAITIISSSVLEGASNQLVFDWFKLVAKEISQLPEEVTKADNG